MSANNSTATANQTTVTLEHTWTIDHFTSHIDGNDSRTLHSAPFTLGYGYPRFYLSLFPNDDKEHKDSTVFLFLFCPEKPTKDVTVKAECSFIDKNGKPFNIKELKYRLEERIYGWYQFIARSFLLDPANGLLPNDQLKIQGQITFFYKDHTQSLYITSYQKHSACLQKALDSGQHSDVILSVCGTDIPAHKFILCAQSAVFESMFEHKETKEAQEGKVTIDDVDVDTFKVLLKYLYIGKIPDTELLTEELLVASDKYLVNTLKLACEEHLSTTLTINSAVELFLFADTHNAAILKKFCLSFIVANAAKVRLTDGWKTMVKIRPELMDEIIQQFASKRKHDD